MILVWVCEGLAHQTEVRLGQELTGQELRGQELRGQELRGQELRGLGSKIKYTF